MPPDPSPEIVLRLRYASLRMLLATTININSSYAGNNQTDCYTKSRRLTLTGDVADYSVVLPDKDEKRMRVGAEEWLNLTGHLHNLSGLG